MDSTLKKELNLIEKRKLKAQKDCDLVEEAKLCNQAGELLSQYGFFEKAAHEHKLEIQLSEAAQDKIGTAIAHRKVGECLCEMGKYKDALFHQNLHLELAKSTKNLVEEQRALATIGRTWFVCSDTAADEEVEDCLLQAQLSYRNSLSVCDKLHHTVADKELLEMRSRLFLNLGLVYESRDYSLAQKFMERALAIARDQGLSDTEFRCYYALGSVLVKKGQDAKALRVFELALEVARKHNKKFDEADALTQLGQIFMKLGEFSAGRRTLKRAYKIAKSRRSDDLENLRSSLVTAIKGLRLQRKYEQLCKYTDNEQIKILDQLGDLYSQGKAFHRAIHCYKKELELAKKCCKSSKDLSSIYVSIAITLGDLKRYSETIQCYEEELETIGDNNREKCDTWCNIAYVHEVAGHDYSEVEQAYLTALDFAIKANKPSLQLRVYRALGDTQKKYNQLTLYGDTQKKIVDLENNHGAMLDDSDSEGEGEGSDGEGEGNDDHRQVLLERELLLSESEEEEVDDGETHSVPVAARRQHRTTRAKLNKLNEKGETPLHQAVIAGDTARVEKLLEKGADINARDYCGWQPLHEACNHGHEDVVSILLTHGAKVNDRGGTHCRGVTPLHDAAVNGHLGVVQLLYNHGASLSIKDDDGHTALDAVIASLRNEDMDDLENSEGNVETETVVGRQRVKKFLRSAMRNQRQGPLLEMRRRNQVEIDSEQNDTFSQLNNRLQERERIRNQKRNLLGEKGAQSFADNDNSNFFDVVEYQNIEGLDDSQDTTSTPLHLPKSRTNNENSSANVDFNKKDDTCDNEDTRVELEEYDSTYSSMDEERPELMDDLSDDFVEEPRQRSSSSLTFADTVTGERGIASSSRSKALINESDPSCKASWGEDNWLVDDMPQSSKRKRAAKQVTLTGKIARTSKKKTSSNSNRTKNRTSRSHRQMPVHNRQALLQPTRTNTDFNTSPSIIVDNYSEDNSEDISMVTNHSQLHTRTQTHNQRHVPEIAATPLPIPGPPPMRLQVKIEDKSYLIPCPIDREGESKTVAWLTDQASLRYYSTNGNRPTLVLQTSYGAFLSPEDRITDVLSNNEEVIASIQSWDLKPLIDRYKSACLNLCTDDRRDISHILESEPHLTALVLPNAVLCAKHVLPLSKALQRHDGLVKLVLPGNRLGDQGVQYLSTAVSTLSGLTIVITNIAFYHSGDQGVQYLSTAVPTLSGLTVLNLQANGISHIGLSHFASSLTAAGEDNAQDVNGLKLEELYLGYNDVGDGADGSLSVILDKCRHLSSLGLESCGLTGRTFETSRKVAKALKASTRLQRLLLSYNELGPAGICDVLNSLPSSVLHLDMSSTAGDKRSQKVADHFKAYLDREECCLQSLSLGDCHMNDIDAEKIAHSKQVKLGLKSLDLSCNNITNIGTACFSRCSNQHLTSLNLAGNTGVCNNGLLHVLNSHGSSLQKLDVSACGLTSPLDSAIFAEIKLLLQRSETSRLQELDLSHNQLNCGDKQQLLDIWNSFCNGGSSVFSDDHFCLLCRVVT